MCSCASVHSHRSCHFSQGICIVEADSHLRRKVSWRSSLKWVHAMTFGGSLRPENSCSVALSKPMPSAASVPFPNSSIMHSDLHRQAILWGNIFSFRHFAFTGALYQRSGRCSTWIQSKGSSMTGTCGKNFACEHIPQGKSPWEVNRLFHHQAC